MASATTTRTLSRWTTRPVLLAIVVVALAMVGLALLAEAMSGGGGTVYLAQIQPGGTTGGVPSLVAVGYGQAAVPAERAELQLLFSSFDGNFAGGPGLTLTPGATPGTAERQAAEPIVAAIVAAGLPAERIRVVTSAAFPREIYGPSSVFTFRIDVTLDLPTLEALTAVVDAAGQAAVEGGLRLVQVGVGYYVEDCTSLRDLAWADALEDGQRRAAAQAERLGVRPGDLVLAQEEPVVPLETTGLRPQTIACAERDSLATLTILTGSAGVSLPPFDPTAPIDVIVAARLHLAYEIVES